MTTAGDGAIEVVLRSFPVSLHARAEEHHRELLREFFHIAHADGGSSDRVPDRLLALVDEVQAEYAPVAGPPRKVIEDARVGGREEIDLRYVVPPGAIRASERLIAEFEEADEFCRSGDLLTLATPDELARFRRWFLREFQRQSAGHAPTPWPQYAEPATA